MSSQRIRRPSVPHTKHNVGKKGLKVLGLSAMHIVESFLDGPKNGALNADEYFMFWRDLGSANSERDNTEFLRVCIAHLLDVMNGKKQLSTYNTILVICASCCTLCVCFGVFPLPLPVSYCLSMISIEYPWHSLVNTISFVSLRMPTVPGTSKLRSTMKGLQDTRGDRGNFSAADEVYGSLAIPIALISNRHHHDANRSFEVFKSVL